MKILISLIGIDKQIRSSIASSLKRLLNSACNDKDEVILYLYLYIYIYLYISSFIIYLSSI